MLYFYGMLKERVKIRVSNLHISFMFYKYVCNLWFNSSMGGPYHIDTSPLICTANQWTGLHMIRTFVMKELK